MFRKKRIGKEVFKLSLEQGDVIVLRAKKAFQAWVKVMEALVKKVKETKGIDITILVVPDDIRFGSINETVMNNAGWFRQDMDEVKRILAENKMLRDWNENIKKLHVEESLKAHDEKIELKKKLETYEKEKGVI